jgi:hypothetical protein
MQFHESRFYWLIILYAEKVIGQTLVQVQVLIYSPPYNRVKAVVPRLSSKDCDYLKRNIYGC